MRADDGFAEIFVASVLAACAQTVLPNCCVPGCVLSVANEGPTTVYNGQIVHTGPRVPTSDKCWYHANGHEPPPGAW